MLCPDLTAENKNNSGMYLFTLTSCLLQGFGIFSNLSRLCNIAFFIIQFCNDYECKDFHDIGYSGLL